jgi:hypothetical protein
MGWYSEFHIITRTSVTNIGGCIPLHYCVHELPQVAVPFVSKPQIIAFRDMLEMNAKIGTVPLISASAS